ncbi:MAG: HAMP domain-containing protein [Spirochaetaceae bacterium]|nr:MAG: HAMP domain-containing protein [Spirochaetaceae bacterium]
MRRGSFHSLRARVYFVVACSVLPAVVLLPVLGYNWSRSEVSHAHREALTTAQALSSRRVHLVESSGRLLSGLSYASEIIALDPEGAAVVLRRAYQQHWQHSNFALVNRDGLIISSAVPQSSTINLSDRLHVREALQTGRLAVGELVSGRTVPVIALPIAYPVRSRNQRTIIGVLAAIIPLDAFDGQIDPEGYLDGTVVLSLDRLGRVISSHRYLDGFYAPAVERFPIGEPVDRELWFAAYSGSERDQFRYREFIGASAASLLGTDPTPFAYSIILVPEEAALVGSRIAVHLTLVAFAAAALLLLAIGRFLTDRALIHPVSAVSESLRRIADGDLGSRADKELAFGEFAPVAAAINEMAERLQRHEVLRDQAEEQLTQNVREKAALLRELHHRTKNNLQMIISLINLQESTLSSVPSELGVAAAGGTAPALNDAVSDAFNRLRNRIYSLSIAHERLYEAEVFDRIEIGDYLHDLVEALSGSFQPDGRRVTTTVTCEPIELTIEIAVAVGMVVNELVTNSFKHAFPDRSDGTITIGVTREGASEAILHYADDGVGRAQSADTVSGGLGTVIVSSIVESQMHGSIDYPDEGKGFAAVIRFRLPS